MRLKGYLSAALQVLSLGFLLVWDGVSYVWPIPTVQCCLLSSSCLGLYLLSSAAFFHPAVSLPIPTVRCCVLSSSCLGLYRLSSAAFSRPVLPSRPVFSAYTYCPVLRSLVQLSRPIPTVQCRLLSSSCPDPCYIRPIPTAQCGLLSSSCLGLYLVSSAAFSRPVVSVYTYCPVLPSRVQCCLLSSSAAFSHPVVPTLVTSGLYLLSSAAFSRPVLPSLVQLSPPLLHLA